MALRQITTQPRPSASDARPIAWVPGIPISCAVTSTRGVADVAPRDRRCAGPSRKLEISADVPIVNMIVAIAPSTPPASAT